VSERCDLDRLWPTIQTIEGWFYRDAAGALLDLLEDVLVSLPPNVAVVEIGSYHGRSTALIAGVVKAVAPGRQVVAIDPHEGRISESGRPDGQRSSTWESFNSNLRRLDLTDVVDVRRARSTDVEWSGPIGLLYVDGLHDVSSVGADFEHFAPHVVEGGIVAFDDYSPNFRGVMAVVDDVLRAGVFEKVTHAGDLVAVRRSAGAAGPT
jgi:cephalosporin hydroxylase